MSSLLIHNIGMLATPTGMEARRGADQGQIEVLENAWIYIENDEIIAYGNRNQPITLGQKLDAGGRLVTPGLVDAHTHLIFGGWRQNELAMKIRNVPYLDILAAGGGILSSVKATRAATEEELSKKASAALDEMLGFGTTTCEAKSGYGLNLEDELKQLRVIRRLNEAHRIDVMSTFMGAHAVPEEFKDHREDYVNLICDEMIPEIARIISVADAYDAMTSHRSYRSAIPQQLVREEIVKNAGTQFDPDMAKIMQYLIDIDNQYEMKERKEAKELRGDTEIAYTFSQRPVHFCRLQYSRQQCIFSP